MAAKFKLGDVAKLNAVVPQGPVKQFRMTDDGTVQCLITWDDEAGVTQERWFNEDDLTGE
jgi:uncharacterized protein YodC (DUF2158 family)